MSRLSAPTPDWFSWKHANAGAVTTDFKQCETDRIFLGAEYATDETFLPAPPNNLACSRRSRNGAGSIPAATRNSTCYPGSNPRSGTRTTARALQRKTQPQLAASVPEIPGTSGGGGSACSPPEIVRQHEPEADYQDANSDAHQHESSSRGPECCTPPCPLPLVWDGYGPDRAGHPRRVIGSAPHENKCVPSQFSKSPAPSPVLLKEVADKISRRNQPRDHKGRVKTGAGLEHFGARRPA